MKIRMFCLSAFLFMILLSGCSSNETELTVGFLYTGNIQDYGVMYAQDLAREEIVKEMNGTVQTIVKESVDESHVESVIYDMVNSGAKLIFVSDNRLQEQIVNAANVYKDVDFVVYNGNAMTENVKSYAAKYYEADYLAGILAGKSTKTNTVGYVAPDNSQPNLVRINAFALGVLKSNPDAIVDLDYVGEDGSQNRINAALSKLSFDRCDVIATCSSKNKVLIEAANRGINVIGNTSSGLADKEALIAAITYDFKDFYMDQIESVINGSFDASQYTGTVADEFLTLDNYNVNTSKIAKSDVNKAKAEMSHKNLEVFTGPFSDNAGNQIATDGQVLNESDIAQMNYLLSNVKVLS